MAVEYLKYGNKKLPVKIGYYTLKMMFQEHGVSMEQLSGDITLYEPLLFYSLQQGHKATNKEFKYKLEDMVDILDDCFMDFVEIIFKFFPEEKMSGVGGTK
jgi:hypothetical protein